MVVSIFNKALHMGRLILLGWDPSDKATAEIGSIGYNIEGLGPAALGILKDRPGILATKTIGTLWKGHKSLGPEIVEELSRRGDKAAENVILDRLKGSGLDTLDRLEIIMGASQGFRQIGGDDTHDLMRSIINDARRPTGLAAIKRLKDGEERLHDLLNKVAWDFPDLREAAQATKEGPVRFRPMLPPTTGTPAPAER